MPVRDRGREAEVLLDQQHGEAARLDLADGAADLLHDDRRETFGRLVQQQHLGTGAQDAGDRQHLLLAARQLGALGGVRAFLQVGEQREDLLDRQPARGDDRRQHQVFGDRQGAEDAALFRADGNAGTGDHVGLHADRLGTAEADAALTTRHQAHDRLHGGGLAGAIAAQQRHHLALAHFEIHPMQDVALAVPGVQVFYFKHGVSQTCSEPR